MASMAVAQTNKSAYFLLDYDLEAPDYQGAKEILDIGGRELVGFALYARQWENAKGFTVEFYLGSCICGVQVEYISSFDR